MTIRTVSGAVPWAVSAAIVLWLTVASFPLFELIDRPSMQSVWACVALSLPFLVSVSLIAVATRRGAGISVAVGIGSACLVGFFTAGLRSTVLHMPFLLAPPVAAVPLFALALAFFVGATTLAWRECGKETSVAIATVSALVMAALLVVVGHSTSAFLFVWVRSH